MIYTLSRSLKYIISIIATILVTSGVIYAVNIISLGQTANQGDTITSSWVNAVNGSISASSSSRQCITISNQTECVTTLKTMGQPDSVTFTYNHTNATGNFSALVGGPGTSCHPDLVIYAGQSPRYTFDSSHPSDASNPIFCYN